MNVISHRGLWAEAKERNTIAAFQRSFLAGYGTEIDVRDLDGTLVVSHDPPRLGALPLADVLAEHAVASRPGVLAINIKANGLALTLANALADTPSWFAFDMAVPDTLAFVRGGLPYFTRQSEYEPAPPLLDDAAGVWIDSFRSDWVQEQVVRSHLDAGRAVCLVSPELHGRPHQAVWEDWSRWELRDDVRVSICTDYPQRATEVLA